MPSITVGFEKTDPIVKRVIEGVEETVYDITVSGAASLSLSLTPTEFGWKRGQLDSNAQLLQDQIAIDSNQLDPKDTSAGEAALKIVRRNQALATILANLIPGGALA